MKNLYLLFVTVFFLTNGINAQTKIEKIDQLVSKYAEYGQFNGSVLVAEKGEVIYKKGFGFANVEWSIPNQPDTKHRLASITKQFTAMLILQLAAENKIKLHDPVSTYLPDYPKKTGDIVTIHHLLTHTSGIPSYTSMSLYRDMMAKTYSPEEIVRLFADSTLEFTPGERFQYSNSGYVLLGYILEKLTGQSYMDVLQSRIFAPLKMNNSGYDVTSSVIRNRASGYDRFGNELRNTYFLDMSVPFAAGGIYSTVEDLYLWDQALYTDVLLPSSFRDLLFEKHIASGQNDYGYGWEMGKMPLGNTLEQVETISHSGGINGFNTLITRIPVDKTLIVFLNNTGGAPLSDMTIAIAGILKNKTYAIPRKSVANSLSDVIEKKGIDAARLHYTKIKDSRDYDLLELEMNSVGYSFLQSGRPKEAVFVFKLNVDAFPGSFNTYDSYGEALLALGDTIESIRNYKKSLELNPGNEYGLKALKSLGISTDAPPGVMSQEEMMLLEGEYLVTDPPREADKEWRIMFKIVNGELTGNDRGYRYKLIPVGKNEFVNPDDGASLVFNSIDEKTITLTLLEKFKFKKVM